MSAYGTALRYEDLPGEIAHQAQRLIQLGAGCSTTVGIGLIDRGSYPSYSRTDPSCSLYANPA